MTYKEPVGMTVQDFINRRKSTLDGTQSKLSLPPQALPFIIGLGGFAAVVFGIRIAKQKKRKRK